MEIKLLIGYLFATIVGITLGLIGSGGSILSVPILVYILGVEPILATAYSLFIVGTTALFGGVQKAKQNLVDYKKVLLFGIPTLLSVFVTRRIIVPNIPEILFSTSVFTLHKSVFIMVVFAVVMIMASVRMIKPMPTEIKEEYQKLNYRKIFFQGILIGLIAGFVGAGGGFLIIPALVVLSKLPMKEAVGTSLVIIAAKSLIGFFGEANLASMDWVLLSSVSAFAIVGIFIGARLSKKIDGAKLKPAFGWFVLVMGIYIIIKETLM